MKDALKYDVVIIGAGPAGMCAALYAGRSMLKAVVLERGFPGGELLNTELVEDYPGFESILGHELAEKFQAHAVKFGADFRNGMHVTSVRKRDDGQFDTQTSEGDVYRSPAVIITVELTYPPTDDTVVTCSRSAMSSDNDRPTRRRVGAPAPSTSATCSTIRTRRSESL